LMQKSLRALSREIYESFWELFKSFRVVSWQTGNK
jgi:hypothetical protein